MDENEELFDQYRAEAMRLMQSNSEAYDRAILAISSLLFASIVGFLQVKGDAISADSRYWLIISAWLLFGAVLATVFSFLFANWALGAHIKRLKRVYIGDEDSSILDKKYCLDYCCHISNYVAGGALLVSVALAGIFVIPYDHVDNSDEPAHTYCID